MSNTLILNDSSDETAGLPSRGNYDTIRLCRRDRGLPAREKGGIFQEAIHRETATVRKSRGPDELGVARAVPLPDRSSSSVFFSPRSSAKHHPPGAAKPGGMYFSNSIIRVFRNGDRTGAPAPLKGETQSYEHRAQQGHLLHDRSQQVP